MVAFRRLLLIYWAVLALLGHAGTHALADYLGVCVHVDTQDPESARADAVGGDKLQGGTSHTGCQHCLRHQRKQWPAADVADNCAEERSDHSGSHSGHDAANCRLCDWFIKFTPQGLSVQPCLLPVPTELFSDTVLVNPISVAVPSARSRGPPSLQIV